MRALLALIGFLIIAGCGKTDSINQPTEDQAWFPMANGYQWRYQDSLGPTTANTVTEVVSSSMDSNGVTWWNVSNQSFATALMGDKITLRNDSVFSQIATRLGQKGLGLLLVPPRDTTFFFMRGESDVVFFIRVTPGTMPCQVPAGSFLHWASYVSDNGLEKDSLVIATGIGVLSRTLTGVGYPGRPAFLNRSLLLTYKLK
jgi:hypothetical protein